MEDVRYTPWKELSDIAYSLGGFVHTEFKISGYGSIIYKGKLVRWWLEIDNDIVIEFMEKYGKQLQVLVALKEGT